MKNKTLIQASKTILLELLIQCTGPQRLMFKKMYCNKNLDATIEEAVEQMDVDKIDWAITQTEATLTKKYSELEEKYRPKYKFSFKVSFDDVYYDFMKLPDFPEPPSQEDVADKWFIYEQRMMDFFRKHNIEVTEHIARQFDIRIK